MSRRGPQGRMAEILGPRAVFSDEFYRTVGIYEIAKETLPNLSKQDLELFQAYADGVNDFVRGIGANGAEATANYLPPEFKNVGLTEFVPWTPLDTLSVLGGFKFWLTWNWPQDSMRETLRLVGLGDLAD